ncbi:hypothetical protein R83H12_01713 [Fibrobacteria bacterium R8-3-H12]
MKKSTLAPAIIAISMMLSPTAANAFWLDIIKAAAKGLVTIVADNQKDSPGNKIHPPQPRLRHHPSRPANGAGAYGSL